MRIYREILEDRINEKAKRRKAFHLMTRLLVGSSTVIFFTLLVVWLSHQAPEVVLPESFYWNTGLVLLSSGFLFKAVDHLKKDEHVQAHTWVTRTFWSGLGFAIIQALGWRQVLIHGEVRLNIMLPITSLHFLHVVIGLVFIWLSRRKIANYEFHSRNLAFTQNVSLFWHFLAALWVLFLLLF